MPTITTEGLILKAKNHSEADRIYTVYSKRDGKIRVVAKGVRKISSRRSGSLDALNLVSFAYSKRGSFPSLTEVSVVNSFSPLKKNLEKVRYGFEILELVDKFLTEEEENRQIYSLLVETLQNLNRLKDGGRRLALANFKTKLLGLLGYDPVINHCVACYRELDDTWETASFSNPMGGVLCDRCHKGESASISFSGLELFRELRTQPFRTLQEAEIGKKELLEVEDTLTHYCEYLLSAPIRSSNYLLK